MRRSGIATLCAGMFSVAVGLGIANAQSSPAKPDVRLAPASPTNGDAGLQQKAAQPLDEHQFVPQAAMANMAEIQLGHLALKKAQSPEVKKFAQMMIDDHVKAQNELADAAYGAGIQWPKQLDDKHQQIQQRLSALSDQQFDREYMKTMVDGHRDVEKMLAARVGNGGAVQTRPSSVATSDGSPLVARVNEWTAKTLTSVRDHLKQAEQIYGGLRKAV